MLFTLLSVINARDTKNQTYDLLRFCDDRKSTNQNYKLCKHYVSEVMKSLVFNT